MNKADVYFEEKLPYYNTAWSLVYECYIKIEGFHRDTSGDIIIIADIGNKKVLHRVNELSKFAL